MRFQDGDAAVVYKRSRRNAPEARGRSHYRNDDNDVKLVFTSRIDPAFSVTHERTPTLTFYHDRSADKTYYAQAQATIEQPSKEFICRILPITNRGQLVSYIAARPLARAFVLRVSCLRTDDLRFNEWR